MFDIIRYTFEFFYLRLHLPTCFHRLRQDSINAGISGQILSEYRVSDVDWFFQPLFYLPEVLAQVDCCRSKEFWMPISDFAEQTDETVQKHSLPRYDITVKHQSFPRTFAYPLCRLGDFRTGVIILNELTSSFSYFIGIYEPQCLFDPPRWVIFPALHRPYSVFLPSKVSGASRSIDEFPFLYDFIYLSTIFIRGLIS